MIDELYLPSTMIKTVTIDTGVDNEFPSEGFCWTHSCDPIEDACAFCVIFGVPTWSFSANT